MEKSNLASILQRKKNKNLTLAHRQLWGMIDLVYKDFYDKESKIFDAGNVTREEFAIIKHVYKTSVNDTLRMYKNDDIRMYNFNCITDTIVEVITTCNTYTLLTVHLL